MQGDRREAASLDADRAPQGDRGPGATGRADIGAVAGAHGDGYGEPVLHLDRGHRLGGGGAAAGAALRDLGAVAGRGRGPGDVGPRGRFRDAERPGLVVNHGLVLVLGLWGLCDFL